LGHCHTTRRGGTTRPFAARAVPLGLPPGRLVSAHRQPGRRTTPASRRDWPARLQHPRSTRNGHGEPGAMV